MNIRLQFMTKQLCRAYMQDFVLDPALFADPGAYQPYIYDQNQCDAYFERYQSLGRIHFAVMLNEEPIGEIVLKKIDTECMHCTIGISLKNDSYKNKGYGTKSILLALNYAFDELELQTVYADALLTNHRSRHVLQKAGFQISHQDDVFEYFRCDKM